MYAFIHLPFEKKKNEIHLLTVKYRLLNRDIVFISRICVTLLFSLSLSVCLSYDVLLTCLTYVCVCVWGATLKIESYHRERARARALFYFPVGRCDVIDFEHVRKPFFLKRNEFMRLEKFIDYHFSIADST